MHEMIFGIAIPVILGFLLTASMNWTRQKTVSGLPLVILVAGCWLISRLCSLIPDSAQTIPFILDVVLLLAGAFYLARALLLGRNTKNYFFIALILAFIPLHILMHYYGSGQNFVRAADQAKAMIMLVVMFMVIMGGRIIPAFTANKSGKPRIPPLPLVESLSVVSVLLLVITFSSGVHHLSPAVASALGLLAGLSNLIRLVRWQFWAVLNDSLLWSLHVAYLMLSLGCLSIVAMAFVPVQIFVGLFHLLTIGGIGGLVLAMISRIALAQTARPLSVSRWTAMAYLLVLAAACLRALAPLLPDLYSELVVLSAGTWVLAFGIFIIEFLPILLKPAIR